MNKIERRKFNKLLSALPFFSILPVKKAIADTSKPKRDPCIFYEGLQLTVYENDIFEPKIMNVNISTDFNLETAFGLGQLAVYEKRWPTETRIEIEVFYPKLQVLCDFDFKTFGENKLLWTHSLPNEEWSGNYYSKKVQVFQDGHSVLETDPYSMASCWDLVKPVSISIDFAQLKDEKTISKLHIKDAVLNSISYRNILDEHQPT